MKYTHVEKKDEVIRHQAPLDLEWLKISEMKF